jgi:putative hemolysin
MEDLMEELVGDIKDEYDEEPETTRTLTGALEVDGLLNLDDFEDETGLELPDGPYETVAGYLIQQLGRLPEKGDTATFDGFTLTVIELDGRRIARVKVEANQSTPTTAAASAPASPTSPPPTPTPPQDSSEEAQGG